MTNIPVSLPLDADGFLRRECPSCERQFKWHHGKTEEAPDDYVYPSVHWCPLCGQSAALNQWWTPAQADYARDFATGPLLNQLTDQLKDAVQGSKFIKVESSNERVEIPDPLVELDDMAMIAPPCHPWEPVKVPDESSAPYYCLLCGEAYAV
ncbi:MAG: hypothetical protein ABIP33_07810 [Pseudolysinimonas sp.]